MFLPTYRSRHQFPIMFQPASARPVQSTVGLRSTHTVHAMSFACTPRTVSPSDDRAPLSSRSHYICCETTVRQQSRRLLLWAALHRRSMRPFATYLTRSVVCVCIFQLLLCVGRTSESSRNGWTDRDVVRGTDLQYVCPKKTTLGCTWRHLANMTEYPCAAAMRPFVNWLWLVRRRRYCVLCYRREQQRRLFNCDVRCWMRCWKRSLRKTHFCNVRPMKQPCAQLLSHWLRHVRLVSLQKT